MLDNWPNCLFEISNNYSQKKTKSVSFEEQIKIERHRDECSEIITKIIKDKLADQSSSLSKYLLKEAKHGHQKVRINPLRALSVMQYHKYWRAACDNHRRTNFLLSQNSSTVQIKIKSEQNKLVISWNK